MNASSAMARVSPMPGTVLPAFRSATCAMATGSVVVAHPASPAAAIMAHTAPTRS
jgi:hypothetical protein